MRHGLEPFDRKDIDWHALIRSSCVNSNIQDRIRHTDFFIDALTSPWFGPAHYADYLL
jgi:hypothetical protein